MNHFTPTKRTNNLYSTMQIEAHIIAWNEIDTIHLTIKHYQKFCNKIFLHDNYSNDGTDKVAEMMGATVVKFGKPGELSDKEYLKIKNAVWKRSNADWVILVDEDEILWHPEIGKVLREAKENGDTIFKTQGWQVFSKDLPKFDMLEITKGFADENYSKSAIFNPKALTNINFSYGCHTSQPQGTVKFSDQTLTLFHYRNIGGVARLVERHSQYRKRLSALNKEIGLGIHYTYEDERRIREWNEQYEKSVEYSLVGI
jgi:glycosyltransferase involved in cell wall biosynthesis